MKQLIVYILLAGFASLQLSAQSNDILFAQGNEAYAEGKFMEAAALYDSIVRSGVVNKDVYFNLANAYYKLGKTAPSILYYERALRIDPSDEDIQHNLNLANLRVITKLEATPLLFYEHWWAGMIALFGSAGWAWLGILAIWITLLLAAIFLFTNSTALKRVSFFVGATTLAMALVLLFLSLNRYRTETDQSKAIVTSANVYIKSAPDDGSTDLFILHEGVKAKITDQVNEWRQIRLSDGKVGWVKASALEVI